MPRAPEGLEPRPCARGGGGRGGRLRKRAKGARRVARGRPGRTLPTLAARGDLGGGRGGRKEDPAYLRRLLPPPPLPWRPEHPSPPPPACLPACLRARLPGSPSWPLAAAHMPTPPLPPGRGKSGEVAREAGVSGSQTGGCPRGARRSVLSSSRSEREGGKEGAGGGGGRGRPGRGFVGIGASSLMGRRGRRAPSTRRGGGRCVRFRAARPGRIGGSVRPPGRLTRRRCGRGRGRSPGLFGRGRPRFES